MKTCLTREVLMAVNCATFPLETSFCGSFRGQSHFGIRNLLSLIFLHKREDGPWLILPAVKDNCHKDWGGATGRSTDCGIRWGGLKPVQPLFSCGRRLFGFFFFFFFNHSGLPALHLENCNENNAHMKSWWNEISDVKSACFANQ